MRATGRVEKREVVRLVGGQVGARRKPREGEIPRVGAIVRRAVAQVHIDGAVIILLPAEVVAKDDGVAGPGVPADKNDLARRRGARVESGRVVAAVFDRSDWR